MVPFVVFTHSETRRAFMKYVMKYVVLPLSAVARLTPFEPAAMIGHAFLVGLPIAFLASARLLRQPTQA
jgi:hypothetical protein